MNRRGFIGVAFVGIGGFFFPQKLKASINQKFNIEDSIKIKAPARRKDKEVIELVKRYLEPHQPKDGRYRLEVFSVNQIPDDDWYYVTVKPDRDGIPHYDVMDRLVLAETEIESKEGIRVLLVS